MIRALFPLGVLFFTTAALAATNPSPSWPKNFTKDFKDKTFQQAFCEKPPGFQTKALCNYLKKNSLNEKLISVSVQGATLTLQDGKRTVEIKKTQNDLQFEINRKVIDLATLRDPAQLLAALNKAIPKVASHSLWINTAHAQEDSENEGTMVRMSAYMLSASADQVLCSYAQKFIIACAGNINDAPEGTQYKLSLERFQSGKIKTPDDDYLRWLLSNTDELVVRLYRMEQIVKGLDKHQVRQSLRSCPSIVEGNKGMADSDMDLCGKMLGERKAQIKQIGKIAEKYKEQLQKQDGVSSQLEDIAGTKKTATPSSKASQEAEAIR